MMSLRKKFRYLNATSMARATSSIEDEHRMSGMTDLMALAFRVIAIYMKHGCIDHLADVGAVQRRSSVMRGCGITDAIATRCAMR